MHFDYIYTILPSGPHPLQFPGPYYSFLSYYTDEMRALDWGDFYLE